MIETHAVFIIDDWYYRSRKHRIEIKLSKRISNVRKIPEVSVLLFQESASSHPHTRPAISFSPSPSPLSHTPFANSEVAGEPYLMCLAAMLEMLQLQSLSGLSLYQWSCLYSLFSLCSRGKRWNYFLNKFSPSYWFVRFAKSIRNPPTPFFAIPTDHPLHIRWGCINLQEQKKKISRFFTPENLGYFLLCLDRFAVVVKANSNRVGAFWRILYRQRVEREWY